MNLFFESENNLNDFEYNELEKNKKICYGNLIPSRSGKGYFKRVNYKIYI